MPACAVRDEGVPDRRVPRKEQAGGRDHADDHEQPRQTGQPLILDLRALVRVPGLSCSGAPCCTLDRRAAHLVLHPLRALHCACCPARMLWCRVFADSIRLLALH